MLKLINKIKYLTRIQKQLIMLLTDLFLLFFAFWISLSLRLGNLWPNLYILENILFLFLIPFLFIPFFIHYGLYRAVLKYMGYQVILATVKSVTLSILFLGLLLLSSKEIYLPRSTIIIFWFVSILLIIASRYLVKSVLYFKDAIKKPVAIYGAGEAGARLIETLRTSSKYTPVALFDDSPSKWGTIVHSMFVNSSNEIGNVIKEKNIKIILFAILGISKQKRKEILYNISRFPIQVRMLVGIDNLISGDFNLEQIQSVDVKDIMGREPVSPDMKLLEKNIKNKNILVTGAGGSIGKELCKQIITFKPKSIILYENNEFSLYKIHSELGKVDSDALIIPVLSSIMDTLAFKRCLQSNEIHTVYHAAAYKHVPIVEMNPIPAIRNNILGTYSCVIASIEMRLETFILISSDKAVRPTNIMGATKRFSELILQAADEYSPKTCFSMVRFGNVIDSAGSVVPLFRSQIKNGGPLTVTHPDVTRYFMSIPEAVELVIQAGAMAKGGEVFVLEMGSPIRIIDLAKQMIHLSGYELKNSKNINGDIEIKITGLRPGEKMKEELIIGNNIYSTDHLQILKAEEEFEKWNILEVHISDLKIACESMDSNMALKILKKCIKDWNPSRTSDYYKKLDSELELKQVANIAKC